MRALAQDREATLLMGVDVDRYSAMGFGIGAMLAGSPAASSSPISASTPASAAAIITKAFIMIMIGGAGVVAGAILGAVALGFVEAIGYACSPARSPTC